MTKIYDALKRAEQERGDQGAGRTEATIRPEKGLRTQSLRQKLIAVYQAIEAGLPDKSSRTILFVSARPGEGASTLVRELAILASGEFAQKVALIDAGRGAGGHHERFGVKLEAGFDDVVSGRLQLDEVLQELDGGGLFLGCLAARHVPSSTVLADPKFEGIVKDLREKFSLVLFDSPPLAESSDALIIVPVADGVIMVIEAEKTRWQVAESARERMAMQGANILGIILNRRRFHIPQFIYRRL
jgi:Mrp family chromosome partitioning ATPase